MPSLFFYLLKLSVALAVVHLFYQLVLRRLTFYNWNRWYLLGYTILAFLIPFINITPILESNEWSDVRIINLVPVINEGNVLQNIHDNSGSFLLSPKKIIIIILISGALFLFVRLILQFISFNRMKKKAKPFTENGLTIYQVNENIIPFSFGNSIFINHQLHSEEELREIIKHEFIHVKQKHSMDIIWGELLCLLNWYNPFAWLLKRSIRQNLEFIADNKVVQNGIDKKEYQYLLLKVIGSGQYSIATQFNFSSLKKRIAMMNKTKSAKLQVGWFLFLFPVLAIILLAFRNSFNDSTNAKTNMLAVVLTDTIPDVNTLNSKGYYIDIKDNKGNCMVVIKDKGKKEVKRLLLTEWNEKSEYYENLYGEILSPTKVEIEKNIKASNPEIRTVTVNGNIATVTLKNGKTETYALTLKSGKKAFEERCGIKEVAIEPVEKEEVRIAEDRSIKSVQATEAELEEVVVTGMPLKKVITTNGELKEVTFVGKPLTKTIATNSDLQEVLVTGTLTKSAVSTTGEIKEVTVAGKPAKVATTVNGSVVTNIKNPNVNVVSEANKTNTTNIDSNPIDNGELDIKITITKGTTPEQLEKLIGQLKEKGYELKFTNKDYNDGILTQLSGTIKYKGSNSSFSLSDFDQAIIKVYREGDNVEFRIYTGKNKVAL
jgi:bla regulator protein blaR1